MEGELQVKTEVFEGPLELLLSLIEKRKLLINEISLAKVADDYLAYLRSHPEFPLGQATHFLLIAATLVLIKSKSLLPALTLSEEEQHNIEDLEHRLALYQRCKRAAAALRKRFGTHILYGRSPSAPLERAPLFVPDAHCTPAVLHAAARRVVAALPTEHTPRPEAHVAATVTLGEMMASLHERLQQTLRLSFREFTAPHQHVRHHVVVSFLAVLELFKRGIVRAHQTGAFGDIVIEYEEIDVPHYE